MPSRTTKSNFSQRHPFLFGLTLIMAAVTLLAGVMAALRFTGSGTQAMSFDDERIGVVRLEGVITSAEKYTNWIRTLRDDETVKGVLLRINCPGGAVAPSQEIYHAVKALGQAKPVVVSMSSLAASGGYYSAAPAQLIVANNSTLTGSIGVIMEMQNLEGLFQKLGIKRQALTSGPLKDAGSPFRAMTKKDREYLMGVIRDIHEQFVKDVAQAREMDIEAVRKVADGRALTGNQALEAGLVDKLGTMEDAVKELKVLCGLSGPVPYISGPEEEKHWLADILGELNININTKLPDSQVIVR